jgi:hypothetical protein
VLAHAGAYLATGLIVEASLEDLSDHRCGRQPLEPSVSHLGEHDAHRPISLRW